MSAVRQYFVELIMDATATLQRLVNGQVLIVAWPDSEVDPIAADIGNTTGVASMLRCACDNILSFPRPTDCEACGRSWDLIQAARLALEDTAGRCAN